MHQYRVTIERGRQGLYKGESSAYIKAPTAADAVTITQVRYRLPVEGTEYARIKDVECVDDLP